MYGIINMFCVLGNGFGSRENKYMQPKNYLGRDRWIESMFIVVGKSSLRFAEP